MKSKDNKQPQNNDKIYPTLNLPAAYVYPYLLITITVAATYGMTLWAGFVWDDYHLIVHNTQLTSVSDLWRLMGEDFFSIHDNQVKYGYYRPIVMLSYYLDSLVWHRAAAGFHLTNMLLHLGSSFLVYSLASKTLHSKKTASLFVALLFAAHAIHTENVSWISGRTDLLAGFFFLLAWWLQDVSLDATVRRKTILLGLSLISFLVALLSKEAVVFFPVVIYLFNRRSCSVGRSLLHATLYATAVALYGVVRISVLGVGINSSPNIMWGDHALTLLKGSGIYLQKLAFPFFLDGYMQVPWVAQTIGLWGLAFSVVLGLVALGYWLRGKPPLGALYGSFFASLIPLSNLIKISAPAEMGFPMAERFLYLPSIFFCGLSVLLISRLRWRRAGYAILTIAVIANISVANIRNADWSSQDAFFDTTIAQHPSSYYLAAIMANHHLRERNYETSEALYRTAMQRYQDATGTDNPNFAMGLSTALLQQGNPRSALAIAEPLEKVLTTSASLSYIVGECYRQLGKYEEAEGAFVRSLTHRSDYVPTRLGLALVSMERGDNRRAFDIYNSILELDDNLPGVHESAGEMLRRLGKLEDAMAAFRRATQLNPRQASAHGAICALLAKQLRFEEAATSCRTALKIDPALSEAQVTLAMIYAQQGHFQDAENEMKQVLRKRPNHEGVLANLTLLYFKTQQYNKARDFAAKTLKIAPSNPVAQSVFRQLQKIDGARQ